jgi:hypothetical protein
MASSEAITTYYNYPCGTTERASYQVMVLY